MASALHKCVTYLLRHLPTYSHPRTHTGLKYLALSGLICSLWASFLISAAHIHYKITEIDARKTVHSCQDADPAMLKCHECESSGDTAEIVMSANTAAARNVFDIYTPHTPQCRHSRATGSARPASYSRIISQFTFQLAHGAKLH